jgi:hypothetical protein
MAKHLSLQPCKTPKKISRCIPFKLISRHSLWLLSLYFREEIGMGQVGQVHELLKYFGERTGTCLKEIYWKRSALFCCRSHLPLTCKDTDRLLYLLHREKKDYTVKKGSRVSCLQPGCHKPNSPWAGIIQL